MPENKSAKCTTVFFDIESFEIKGKEREGKRILKNAAASPF